MALKTDSNRSECYDFAQMVNQGEIVLFNDPLMVYPTGTMDDDCIILETCDNGHFDQGFDLAGPLYGGNFLQFENKQFQVENAASKAENNLVKEGLAMLEILHSTNNFCIPEDKPSYVDISEIRDLIGTSKEECPIVISDDDDVIFVDCYKETNSEKPESKRSSECFSKRDGKIRRNPVRSTRNKSKDLSKDVLFEEDFAFLDTSDDDTDDKESQMQDKRSQNGKFKEWPVNVHERPEYNVETKSVETFDYTIRDIQKKGPPPKKPRLETVIVKKKSRKKYGNTRKRNIRAIVEKKIPLDSLKASVSETTYLLKEFFERINETKKLLNRDSEKFSLNDKLDVLRNQVTLYAAVNDIDTSEVLKGVFYGETARSQNS